MGLGLHFQCRAIINKHSCKAISFPFYWNVEDRETRPRSSGGIFSSVNAMELLAMMFPKMLSHVQAFSFPPKCYGKLRTVL